MAQIITQKRIAEGAGMSLEAALIESDGPTGTFFEREGSLPW